jgi:spermidine/putrescine transport system ATP-binding protein
MVVSADLVQISLTSPETANKVRCRFISEEFVGSIVTVFAELENGADFKVQVRQRDLADLGLKAGTVFYASWKATDVHLISESA